MKEKRVDIYLSKAGFAQIVTIAFGSAGVSEDMSGKTDTAIVAGISALTSFALVSLYYRKAKRLAKSKKSTI